MNAIARLAAGLLGLVGCIGADPVSASPSPEAGAPAKSCAARSGTIVAKYTERVGTCGPLKNVAGSDQTTSTYASLPMAPAAPCAGTIRYSTDNCEDTYDTSCPSVDPKATYTTRGTITWNAEGTVATGDLEVATPTCKSTYSVEAKRS
jgi:hypothetical protein